jgi:hypothetical protein
MGLENDASQESLPLSWALAEPTRFAPFTQWRGLAGMEAHDGLARGRDGPSRGGQMKRSLTATYEETRDRE